MLSNARMRELYDRHGVAGLRRGGYSPGDFDFGDLSDVFSAFFGESLFGRSAGQARRQARGADLTAVAEISLAEAFTGATLRVPVRAAADCDRCGGKGAGAGDRDDRLPGLRGRRLGPARVAERLRPVRPLEHVSELRGSRTRRPDTVHALRGRRAHAPGSRTRRRGARGIHDGQRIRLRGEGHAGLEGGAAGDVFVLVRVRPDERLERDGDDLVATVNVTMVEAALGLGVSVPTPEGTVDLELPPGVQPGDVQVVRGRGMPSLGHGRRGDLRVRVAVQVPRRPSRRSSARRSSGSVRRWTTRPTGTTASSSG